MSKGKYSPTVWHRKAKDEDFCFNAYGGQVPWSKSSGVPYNEEIHFDDYDAEGYDRYGYSAYLADGTFVGLCQGVDRNGYTEDEYLAMSDEEFNNLI